MNANEITKPLIARRAAIADEIKLLNAEIAKIDDMLTFYKVPEFTQAARAVGRRRNGNTRKVYETARRLIKERGQAVTTHEIADKLKAEGFEDNYSRGMNTQLSGYLARSKEFLSTSEGWVLKE